MTLEGKLWIWGSVLPGFTHIQLWVSNDARLVVMVNPGGLQGRVLRGNHGVDQFVGVTLPGEEWI